MVKTRGGHAFRPRVRHSSLPPVGGSDPTASASAGPPTAALAAAAPSATAPAATQGSAAVGSSSAAPASHPPGIAAPAPRRYHTWVGPTPPSQPHPRPSQRAPPSKRARTSGPGESSSSKPQESQSAPHQGPVGAPPLNLSPASIIGGHFSTRTLFQGMLIAVKGTCMMRFIMIFHPFPLTRSSETQCS